MKILILGLNTFRIPDMLDKIHIAQANRWMETTHSYWNILGVNVLSVPDFESSGRPVVIISIQQHFR